MSSIAPDHCSEQSGDTVSHSTILLNTTSELAAAWLRPQLDMIAVLTGFTLDVAYRPIPERPDAPLAYRFRVRERQPAERPDLIDLPSLHRRADRYDGVHLECRIAPLAPARCSLSVLLITESSSVVGLLAFVVRELTSLYPEAMAVGTTDGAPVWLRSLTSETDCARPIDSSVAGRPPASSDRRGGAPEGRNVRRDQEIADRFRAGEPQKELARAYGLSPDRIKQIIREQREG